MTTSTARAKVEAPGEDARVQLWTLGAQELTARFARGECSAVDAVEAHIARIEEVDATLHAMVVKRYDAAREEARAADRRRAAGEPLGPLAGVPITIKECLDLEGTPSTFGLPSRRNTLATTDDPYVARLRRAGAIVLGKTNVAQLLFYFESDNPTYGRTVNPWDGERTPGGSSGGQAAIIAAGGSAIGLGTDLAGSNRVPAAFCGVVGLKPTAGRLPDLGRLSAPYGQRAIVSQVGVFGRSVADAALTLEVVNGGKDPQDGTPRPLRDFAAVDITRVRVGVWRDDGTLPAAAACVRAVDEAAQTLRARGAKVVEFAPPGLPEALEILYRVVIADHGKGLRRTLGKNPRDPRIKQLELAGTASRPVLALLRVALKLSGRGQAARLLGLYGDYDTDAFWQLSERLLDYQERWARALDEQQVDVLLSPATALPALRHGASLELGVMGAYSCIYNVLGWPAGVVPVTRVRAAEETSTRRGERDVAERTARATERGSAGLPIAVQLAARPWREDLALAAMAAVEAGASERSVTWEA